MMLSVILFVCSFYYFLKFMGQALVHDVSSKVYDDYHSDKRYHQRTRAIGTFAKSFLFFVAAGLVGFLFM